MEKACTVLALSDCLKTLSDVKRRSQIGQRGQVGSAVNMRVRDLYHSRSQLEDLVDGVGASVARSEQVPKHPMLHIDGSVALRLCKGRSSS